MRKILIRTVGIAVVLFLTGSLMAQVVDCVEPDCVKLPSETPIKLQLVETLYSENSHPGDSVAFEVADDVKIDGITVIHHGALAYGRIVDGTEWARRMGRPGKVALEIKNVTDVTGREIPVIEPRYIKARDTYTEIVLGMPNPYWLLMLGKRTQFPTDKIFVAVTAKEWPVDLTNLTRNCGKVPCSNTTLPTPTKTDLPLKPSTPQFQRAAHSYTVTRDGALIASR
jgi:hypothetical protein